MRRVRSYGLAGIETKNFTAETPHARRRLRELVEQFPSCRLISIVDRGGPRKPLVVGDYEIIYICPQKRSSKYSSPGEVRIGVGLAKGAPHRLSALWDSITEGRGAT